MLLINLGSISVVWPKVVWPDLYSVQGIITFSVRTSAEGSGTVHILKWFCYQTLPIEILAGMTIGGRHNTSLVLITHHGSSVHG